jgi:electron-transferring-flavoprotein dehydrogenase
VPKLTFPGGLLIGDTAGFLNVPKIKGTHMAMKSGIVAAEAVFAHLTGKDNAGQRSTRATPSSSSKAGCGTSCTRCATSARLQVGPVGRHRLWRHRYLRAQGQGAVDHASPRRPHPAWATRPSTTEDRLSEAGRQDHFDRLSSVFLSATNHEENQPCHLRLKDESGAHQRQLRQVRFAPETRYCPAGVYEILGEEEGKPRLQINGQNCLHCKTCDIKDPTQNIDWTVPEGGGGPNYPNM